MIIIIVNIDIINIIIITIIKILIIIINDIIIINNINITILVNIAINKCYYYTKKNNNYDVLIFLIDILKTINKHYKLHKTSVVRKC